MNDPREQLVTNKTLSKGKREQTGKRMKDHTGYQQQKGTATYDFRQHDH